MTLTLAFAACGGDDALSADDYSSQLDAACAEVMQANLELPQIQADEELSIEEVEELAEENGDEFIAKVRDLTPPDDLADVHEDLVEGIEKGPPEDDLEAYLAYQEEGAARYDELGATGCADGIRESNEALEEAHGNAGPLASPDPSS